MAYHIPATFPGLTINQFNEVLRTGMCFRDMPQHNSWMSRSTVDIMQITAKLGSVQLYENEPLFEVCMYQIFYCDLGCRSLHTMVTLDLINTFAPFSGATRLSRDHYSRGPRLHSRFNPHNTRRRNRTHQTGPV